MATVARRCEGVGAGARRSGHIPSGVRHFTARQLGIRDITVLAEYGQRENTRREHAALIRQHYQYREFARPWTFRLTRLLYTRSWISNERLACFSIWRQGGLCNIVLFSPEPLR